MASDESGINEALFGEVDEKMKKSPLLFNILKKNPYVNKEIFSKRINNYLGKEYFPAHILPRDAWFVIRHAELDKVIEIITNSRVPPLSATRISTPLSRFFWLAFKNNEVIRPLISKPYKLLSIFEQWASDEGITDRLSGDTLKTALVRGSPTSKSD